jgi:hypothetical protein
MGKTVTKVESDVIAGLLEGDKFLHHWYSISSQLDFIPHVWATWWTKESIRDCVLNGRYQCWGGAKGNEGLKIIAFSQITDFPANRIFQVFLAFGQGFEEMAPAFEAVWEKFAANTGCTVAEVTGRPGWGPLLRKYGFKQQSCTFTRSVINLRMN